LLRGELGRPTSSKVPAQTPEEERIKKVFMEKSSGEGRRAGQERKICEGKKEKREGKRVALVKPERKTETKPLLGKQICDWKEENVTLKPKRT